MQIESLLCGRHDTIDNEEPLCGDIIAFRHPTFGNYTSAELGDWYFNAHDTNYIRSHWDTFEGLVWLLSYDSEWLPERYRKMLIQGIRMRDRWARDVNDYSNPFLNALILKKRKQFKLTKPVVKGLNDLVQNAIGNLGITQSSVEIVKLLMDIDIVKSYYDYHDWLKEERFKKR